MIFTITVTMKIIMIFGADSRTTAILPPATIPGHDSNVNRTRTVCPYTPGPGWFNQAGQLRHAAPGRFRAFCLGRQCLRHSQPGPCAVELDSDLAHSLPGAGAHGTLDRFW